MEKLKQNHNVLQQFCSIGSKIELWTALSPFHILCFRKSHGQASSASLTQDPSRLCFVSPTSSLCELVQNWALNWDQNWARLGPKSSLKFGPELSSFGSKIDLPGSQRALFCRATNKQLVWATSELLVWAWLIGPGSHPAITCHIPDWPWSNVIFKEFDLTWSDHMWYAIRLSRYDQ